MVFIIIKETSGRLILLLWGEKRLLNRDLSSAAEQYSNRDGIGLIISASFYFYDIQPTVKLNETTI